MKKLGILTYHHSINEGAMLQAYALQEVCKKKFLNVQVEMVNYESLSAIKRDLYNCFRQPRSMKTIVAKLQRLLRLSIFKKKYFALSKEGLVSDNFAAAIKFLNAQNYDGLIVGSDEVWKVILDNSAARKFPNIYWLNNEVQAKKFSYAASANKTDYKNLDQNIEDFIQQSFKSYSLMSVRDQFTNDMVLNFLPKTDKLFRVIDPTLLIDKFEYKHIEKKLKAKKFDFNKLTVVLNLRNSKISYATTNFFKELGWQVISITEYCHHADINFVDILDPLEWATIITYCQFSVTERFHGTIFSIREKVPFLSIEKNQKFDYFKTSKLQSLLDDLHLGENLFVYKQKDFSKEALYNKLEYALKNTDFSHIDELLNLYRKQSLEYLTKVEASL